MVNVSHLRSLMVHRYLNGNPKQQAIRPFTTMKLFTSCCCIHHMKRRNPVKGLGRSIFVENILYKACIPMVNARAPGPQV